MATIQHHIHPPKDHEGFCDISLCSRRGLQADGGGRCTWVRFGGGEDMFWRGRLVVLEGVFCEVISGFIREFKKIQKEFYGVLIINFYRNTEFAKYFIIEILYI